MSIKGRLKKLERERTSKDGRCRGCGFGPESIRTMVIAVQPPGECRPFCEIVDDDTPQPGRPRCHTCQGYMPPVALIEEFDKT